MAWVLALASASNACASSAMSSPAGVLRVTGSFTMDLIVFFRALVLPPADDGGCSWSLVIGHQSLVDAVMGDCANLTQSLFQKPWRGVRV